MTPNRRHRRIALPTSVQGHPSTLEAWPPSQPPSILHQNLATAVGDPWPSHMPLATGALQRQPGKQRSDDVVGEGWRSGPEFARRTANPEQMGSGSCVCSATNCAFPSGVPRILIPSVRHTVPNMRLSLLNLDARVLVQRFRHQVVQVPHPPWLGTTRTNRPGMHSLSPTNRDWDTSRERFECSREQQRHQRVTLFPSFCLRHCPPSPFVVVPIVL